MTPELSQKAAEMLAQQRHKPRWYELERFAPYTDATLVLGGAIVAAGVALFSWRIGLIFGGLELMALSWIVARGEAAERPEKK